MYNSQTKKLSILYILEILKKYSDSEHRLSQKEIADILEREYGMIAERKSIKRNLDDLIDEGYNISFKEVERGKGSAKNTICTDYYLINEFDESELRLLIDGLLFSKYIPYSQCKQLVKKLEGLSSKYFKSRINYIKLIDNDKQINKELFYTIDIIDEAIKKNKKVSFNYCSYDINKNMVPRKDDNGNDKVYIANPYHMVAANSRYYLICSFENHDNLANIRVDRIKNITILNEKIKEIKDKKKLNNLSSHMSEHLYMLSGKSENVRFVFDEDMINDVVDWFGDNLHMKKLPDGKIEASTTINYNSMKIWAMQYGQYITVTSPKELVDDIKNTIDDMKNRYK